ARMLMSFFFFSSRRRHTRFSRDWSSDVCSSDLRWVRETPKVRSVPHSLRIPNVTPAKAGAYGPLQERLRRLGARTDPPPLSPPQIGRASGRERLYNALDGARLTRPCRIVIGVPD